MTAAAGATGSKPWRDYADFLAGLMGPGKVQKISVDAGMGCPHRRPDGSGGCTYCNVEAFSPPYCSATLSVEEQLTRGAAFFARKYPSMRFLAYFQAYTSTLAPPPRLMELYRRALQWQQGRLAGIVIGTRPDCVPTALVNRLTELATAPGRVMVELGAESSHDATLRAVNRGHTWACTARAAERLAAAGIPVGLHLIMGLPGETPEMMLQTLQRVNTLPVSVVKMHHLQILRGTELHRAYRRGEVTLTFSTPEDYAHFCARAVRTLRPDIAIDRFVASSPAALLEAPRWGLKNHEFMPLVRRSLQAMEPSHP